MKRKSLQELTIKDNFMFGAVMSDKENCRIFLEMVLKFPIAEITVSKEKSMIYHPEYKGVRLDIIANDKNQTHYNIEMQVVKKPQLGRRARYYHSQIDMELLKSGSGYDELPDAYVIFICDFDPFDQRRYCYTFRSICREDEHVILGDGYYTIFLSTCGENDQDISEELKKFLKYVRAELEESTADFEDDYVMKLQDAVQKVKASREMGERYMTMEEWIQDERAEAKAEGEAAGEVAGLKYAILERLHMFEESIPIELENQIINEKGIDTLKAYLKQAYLAVNIQEFSDAVLQK